MEKVKINHEGKTITEMIGLTTKEMSDVVSKMDKLFLEHINLSKVLEAVANMGLEDEKIYLVLAAHWTQSTFTQLMEHGAIKIKEEEEEEEEEEEGE